VAIKVATFDFWGTLYENKMSLKHERKDRILQMFKQEGINDITEEMIYREMEKAWVIWDDIWRLEHRTLNVREFLAIVFKALLVELSPEAMDTLCDTLQKAIFTGNTMPIDHVVDAVKDLSGFTNLGVISDTGIASGKYLRQLLERDHGQRFSFGLYSDELGMSKPHPGIFQKVLETTGCKADEVVHIGDLRHTDVLGAQNAGMHTIRYCGVRDDQTPGLPEAEYVFRTIGSWWELSRE